MSATFTFVISLIGLLLLFSIKLWENSRRRTMMPRLRERLDLMVMRLAVRLERSVHVFLSVFSRRLVLSVLNAVTVGVLRALRYVEVKLLSVIALLRGRAHLSPRDDSRLPSRSSHLQSLAEYKQTLKE